MEWRARVDLVDALRAGLAGQALRELIVSLEGVDYLNSAGIGAIFSLRQYLSQAGAKMVVCGANPTIARLLNTVNLPQLIPVVGDVAAARELLEHDRADRQT